MRKKLRPLLTTRKASAHSEDLLSTDPTLADLFGSIVAGKIAAKTATNGNGGKIKSKPQPFDGKDFPSFFKRADGSTFIQIELPRGDATRISFQTDVKNNYFIRRKHRAVVSSRMASSPRFISLMAV